MILLKNITAVEFEPAFLAEGVDIVIDKSEIVAIGQNLSSQYPQAIVKDLRG